MSSTDLAPSCLVALDPILDPNFRRSVVLMLEHDADQGALGLVVNRTTDYPMSELCRQLDLDWQGRPDERVDWGGPVQQETGWIVFGGGLPELPDLEVLTSGLSWGRSQEALRRYAEDPSQQARVFLGYAGWGAGQLEQEIAEGAWLVVPLKPELVFAESLGDLWDDAVRSLGIDPATLVSSQGVN